MLTSVFVGCVAAYYFGLRAGAYAAAATLLALVIAFFAPQYAMALDLGIAVSVFALWRVGSRRPMPADSALALRWLRATVKRVIDFVRARL